MDIYLMEIFNTPCQRASLQALAKTAVYIDFDSLWAMPPSEDRNTLPLCCFASPRLPKLPIHFRITTRNKPHITGSSEPACCKVEIQSKVSKYAFLACKWQFISIRESVKKSIFLKEWYYSILTWNCTQSNMINTMPRLQILIYR